MSSFDANQQPHRRYNPLTREWLLVSPHRTQRPWQGQIERLPPAAIPEYDPTCYMCPGNQRAQGEQNPPYDTTFVFDNDYPALLPESRPEAGSKAWDHPLLMAEPERGICRVVCFSPRHDLTLSNMDRASLRQVVDLWIDQYRELGERPYIGYVQIFENRGSVMGSSNPHPHGQIWATESLPNQPALEQRSLIEYTSGRQSCLLCDYLEVERRAAQRVITANDHFTALVPFWAIWPFETMILGPRHTGAVDQLDARERDALADILKRLTSRYDGLFDVSFPYSMGFHQSPTDGKPHPEWHLHAHFYPPLLRSATVRKFMVGYEMLATPQRDITPEMAAARLREMKEL